MIDRLDFVKQKLMSFYTLAMATDREKHFFLWLYDYARVFDTENDLSGIYETIQKLRELEYKPINDLKPKTEKEIDKTYKLVSKYVAEKKIDHKVVLKELEEYQMAVAGKYTSSRGHLEDLYDKLSYALMTMAEDGSAEDLRFVQQFGNVSDERRVSDWTFSPSYSKYDLLTTGLKQIQETRIWYSWDKLVIAFKVVDDYRGEVIDDLFAKKKHFDAVSWTGLRSEMRDILNEKQNPNSRPYEFISKDYKYYLTKMHQFAVEYLLSEPRLIKSTNGKPGIEVTQDLIREVKWSIEKTKLEVIVRVNSKQITFSLADKTGQTLEYLMDSENDIVSWDAIYKKWTGSETQEGNHGDLKMKVYWNIKAIASRIANEADVSNLIEYKSGDVSFTKKYIRIGLDQVHDIS